MTMILIGEIGTKMEDFIGEKKSENMIGVSPK